MPQITSQRTRQAVLVDGETLTDLAPVDRLELFDEEGNPIDLSSSGGGTGGHEIQDDGTPVTPRAGLDFVGSGVNVADDSANDRTVVTVPGGSAHEIQDEGFLLTARPKLNFMGAGVSAADDPDNDSTRVTVAGPSGHTVQDEGFPLTARAGLNFVGSGVSATDDSANNRTVVTIPGSSSKHTIQDEGSALTARSGLNFVGAGVTATDDSANDRTVVTVPANPTTATMRTPHGFLVGGEITAALVVPDLHVPEATNQATTLVGVIARLESGTSVDVTVRKNAVALGSAHTVTTAKQTFTHSDALANGDAIDLTFANPVGTPTDLGVTLILEHVMTLT